MEDLRILFFLHMVESFLITVTGLKLFGYRTNIRIYLVIGVTHGVIVWLVRGVYRYYNIPFGTHSLILAVIMFLLIRAFSKVSWGTALGAMLAGVSLVMLGSNISMVIVEAAHIEVASILNNPWLHVLVGYTENIFLLLVLLLNSLFKFTFTNNPVQ